MTIPKMVGVPVSTLVRNIDSERQDWVIAG